MAEPATDDATLDARLREAARNHDAATLARCYDLAADRATTSGDQDAAGFFATHALVWAMVAGESGLAEQQAQKLRQSGRLD